MTSQRNCPVSTVAMADDNASSPSIMNNEEFIRQIQSFLTRKEAALTTILSKQWYSAWCTNAVLYLDPESFRRTRTTKRGGGGSGGLSVEFQNFATKSINRYKDQNLTLSELRLWMYIRRDIHRDDHDAITRFYDQLILDALDMGVTVIDLNVNIAKGSPLDYYYTIPPQVFHSASLKELSLCGCRINLDAVEGTVVCSRIVSLKLVQVEVEDETMMDDILFGCPLIEDLTLYECKGLENVNFSLARHNLKNLSARHSVTKKNGAAKMMAEFGTDLYPNLISLELDKVRVDDLFYQNFSFSGIFPFLEKLKLRDCEGHGVIEIVSESLNCLSLIRMNTLTHATVYVPRICNFNFTSSRIPELLFTPPAPDHKWKSYIELAGLVSRHHDMPAGSCLRDFLSELSSSEISLVIDFTSCRIYDDENVQSIIDLPKVENLSVKFPAVESWGRYYYEADQCIAKLCGLLFYCNPKFITPTFATGYLHKTTELGKEVVHKTLKKHVNMKKCHQTVHGVKCIHGLKGVQVEIYNQTLKEWQLHPNPDSAWKPECEEDKVRFSLKWN